MFRPSFHLTPPHTDIPTHQKIGGTHIGIEVWVVLLAQTGDLFNPVHRGVVLLVGTVRTIRACLDTVASHPVKVLITSVELKHNLFFICVINIIIYKRRTVFQRGNLRFCAEELVTFTNSFQRVHL